jgi:hypothetical protein
MFTSVQFTGTYGLEAQPVLGADIVPKLAIPIPWWLAQLSMIREREIAVS